jgi:GNAT superfamily N-acetyltransferase
LYRDLGEGRLQSGEPLRLGVVEAAGDERWAPRILAILGHKSELYRRHIEAAFRGSLDRLDTLFYVGCVADEVVTVSMLAGARGAALYGHVHTVPPWRRRGAATALHRLLPADWEARGYRAVTLSTDPRGHARRLYEAIGFRPVVPDRGVMIWRRTAREGSASGGWTVGPLEWADWGWVSEAACAPPAPAEDLPRSLLFRVPDVRCVDWTFLEVAFAVTGQEPPPGDRPHVRVLRRGGQAVGWAALLPGAAAALGAVALDLFVRPGAGDVQAARTLLEAVDWPKEGVVCGTAGGPGYRAAALAACGFRPVVSLPAWWDLGRGPEAALLWSRAAPAVRRRPAHTPPAWPGEEG